MRFLQSNDGLDDDSIVTSTSKDQAEVEESVSKCYQHLRSIYELDSDIPKLLRTLHIQYLQKGLFTTLPQRFEGLDASRPWLTYWICHSLALLGDQTVLSLASKRIIRFLATCKNKTGGYGGGPGQMSHLATTYAAVNALATLCSEEALNSIDRSSLLQFLTDMKQADGSFTMHKGGECDMRGVYCAISVAYLCNIQNDQLFENTASWIISCQTFEGGFGATPGNEAHGGYTFCAVAALMLLGLTHKCNVKSLLRWIVNKQYNLEGGFAGRTNKLVDACYSFWQGAVLPMIHAILCSYQGNIISIDTWLFHQQAMQEYILGCCQDPCGGLIDKPKKQRDYYHTCYGLSGLSIAQHAPGGDVIIGPESNRLVNTHPVYNVNIDAVNLAQQVFKERVV
ncbi:Protein farnesyltransferase subunit beta-like protein [Dinothrombium tinctorium]|uniref:Protein farnesyltransferase subunit beta n=1 Tax=Dinothrombium tinctorium TaxID=1965070 RepID=A0A3S4QDM2_9ACAR|nr:Protein farnesyltransferase subunit beta-like protein [Dinothrombium tinctorium]